jgi:hypothetical protein
MKWKVRQRTALPTSRPLTISAWTVSIADMQPTEGQEGDPEERPQTARSRSDDLMDWKYGRGYSTRMSMLATMRWGIRMIIKSQSKIANREVDCIDERSLPPIMMYEIGKL